ncbi:MAG: phospho-N-acetylmuramoyl-pentapeptide-transferase [Ruminococcaceae bacterium]|nr:phospho-N-acetylmuramoyl-pentapeptide-transferase [Oscillospiraceae bacterium]
MKLIIVLTLALSFVLTALFTRILIPILKSKKMGQKILDIGPRWHKGKEGTPTMGGIAFICASSICALVFSLVSYFFLDITEEKFFTKLFVTFGFALMCGVIGMIDDYAKFTHGKNEGLSAGQKYILQLGAAGIYLFLLRVFGLVSTSIRIPFTSFDLELGIVYYIIMLLLITGVVNSVNLTDGIDGLASTVTAIVGAFFVVVGLVLGSGSLGIIASLTVGACLGFLVYNFYPAKVFMGDTGSLFLGGLVIGMSILAGNPLISVIVGIIYITETASVMMQVTYFKLTHGKRIFKMSPIHHHFEKCGWSEIKIVSVFSAITLVFAVVAYFGMNI